MAHVTAAPETTEPQAPVKHELDPLDMSSATTSESGDADLEVPPTKRRKVLSGQYEGLTFFDLPREIRDVIYSHMIVREEKHGHVYEQQVKLESANYAISGAAVDFFADLYGGGRNKNLLLANRQVSSEYLQIVKEDISFRVFISLWDGPGIVYGKDWNVLLPFWHVVLVKDSKTSNEAEVFMNVRHAELSIVLPSARPEGDFSRVLGQYAQFLNTLRRESPLTPTFQTTSTISFSPICRLCGMSHWRSH